MSSFCYFSLFEMKIGYMYKYMYHNETLLYMYSFTTQYLVNEIISRLKQRNSIQTIVLFSPMFQL